jgi:hypothetical protein
MEGCRSPPIRYHAGMTRRRVEDATIFGSVRYGCPVNREEAEFPPRR